MIRFALICDNGHEFESWFASNDSFDFQIENKLVACPHCNGTEVAKAVMAPAVARAGGGPGEPAAPAKSPKQNVALLGEGDRELRTMVRELHAKIVAATVDVGAEFPREARRIHDGAAPERPIRGQASLEEARSLLEDGVSILPMPTPPEDRG
ncbi:DUF1178 family protein [Rhodoblastus acidophilus]|uniref:DUF1178 family protein n=1 Tax=Candidatus Rhodoblastus alkanivorans TaxID=2954117 RepID=A0ABS9ZAX4_9HYPH|nr:DUF1178 family protein [Candidatus Rhodoblastus alkanivorans]MCI4677770.1 DUF1178 family protein [Candidatus Rhodoblastus alkanivorans]MCI4684732.1 DUF1178 family protein [Candidatus Rhodoblastus alkanivorans]MDI4642054.1 DUF1178 family protein [Rhodoblastus acidophilus]